MINAWRQTKYGKKFIYVVDQSDLNHDRPRKGIRVLFTLIFITVNVLQVGNYPLKQWFPTWCRWATGGPP